MTAAPHVREQNPEHFREEVAPHLGELAERVARFDRYYPAVQKLIVESAVSRRPSTVEIFGYSYLMAHEAARTIAQEFRRLEELLDDPCAANRWSLQIIPLRGKDSSYMASNFGRLDELIRQEYLWATTKSGSGKPEITVEVRALVMKTNHPDWTVTKIAHELGVHRTRLYEYPRFKNLLGMVQAPKRTPTDRRRGRTGKHLADTSPDTHADTSDDETLKT